MGFRCKMLSLLSHTRCGIVQGVIVIILSILSNYPLYFSKNAVVDSLINICYNIIKQGTYAEFSEGSNNNGNEYWK